ncbi:hypothetical protein DIPPA_54831, partial [Diplonema papillatum]
MAPEPGRTSPVLASLIAVLAGARHCAGAPSGWVPPFATVIIRCNGIATAGSDVYVSHSNGLERFDCADPWDCQSVARSTWTSGYTEAIAVSGEYVYSAHSHGVDLQHTTNFSTTYEKTQTQDARMSCNSIVASKSHVFAACTHMSDPLACLYVFEKPLKHVATGYCSGASSTAVFFEETTSMVYVGTEDGVQAFDARDPTNVVQGNVFSTGYTVT